MEFCTNLPDYIVEVYKTLNTSNLLSLLAIMASAYIPFAIFLIEGNDKTDEEKDVFKVERAVILKYIMHVPFLISSLLVGGISALLFFDTIECRPEHIIHNLITGTLFLISIGILMWIILDVIRWVSSSARPDNVNSFRFKQWEKYLSKLEDKDFDETWNKIFANKKIPDVLQPAYLSIFLKKVASQKDTEKYRSFNILRNNIVNINLDRPDVLEAIIQNAPIDNKSIAFYCTICESIISKYEADLLFHLIDEKYNSDKDAARLIVNKLIFNEIEKSFKNEEKLHNLLSCIPNNWKIHELLKKQTAIFPMAMANAYIPWLTRMVDRQETNIEIAINKIDHINNCIVGDYLDEDFDKTLLADFCEIYGRWFESPIPKNDKTFEKMLVDNYLGLRARYFASFNSYTAYGEKDGKPNFEPSVKRKENGTMTLLNLLFPQIIHNKEHLNSMKKIIKTELKKNPYEYRLNKMLKIYDKIISFTKNLK